MADFAKLNFAKLRSDYGVGFILVLPVTTTILRRYIAEEGISEEVSKLMMCDKSGAAYRALGFNFTFNSKPEQRSIHEKNTLFQKVTKGILMGLKTGPQGDVRQQGGAFVLLRRGGHMECAYSHFDRHNSDQIEIPVILRAAQVPLSFYYC